MLLPIHLLRLTDSFTEFISLFRKFQSVEKNIGNIGQLRGQVVAPNWSMECFVAGQFEMAGLKKVLLDVLESGKYDILGSQSAYVFRRSKILLEIDMNSTRKRLICIKECGQ